MAELMDDEDVSVLSQWVSEQWFDGDDHSTEIAEHAVKHLGKRYYFIFLADQYNDNEIASLVDGATHGCNVIYVWAHTPNHRYINVFTDNIDDLIQLKMVFGEGRHNA